MPENTSPSHPGGAGNSTQEAIAEDLIMSSDGEAPASFAPPPRIAARFNRSTRSTNRKSCASSRRSSVSSLHSGRSNRSNRSGHGGLQSAHIAQHLRRASIIESRKARLADRAAHAEQVRLRAQQAKAAPRPTRFEDRALAAKQAREKYLAQVVANCAEEVKRAKKVAEETKEKKAAEYLKLKGEMEEKLADAEKRRLRYQQNLRRSRATSLPTVEERHVVIPVRKPENEDAAARIIQRAWKSHRRRKIVGDFLELNLDVTGVQNSTFDEVSALLAQERVLTTTSRLLRLCGLQDDQRPGANDSTDVRIFLSAFLILGHPKQVLSQGGDQEEDLINKAKILLMQFQRVIFKAPTAATFSPTSESIVALSEAYADFQLTFTAWKNHDSSILIETMLTQFAELDAIWQTVKNDHTGNVATEYKEGIQHNQTLLLARLKRLAGSKEALKLVNDAVRARRKTKAKQKVIGNVKPRSTSSVAETLPFSLDGASQPSATVEAPQNSSEPSQSNRLDKVISQLPSNRIIVHELAIDKEFRVKMTDSDGRQAFRNAVFNKMRNDIATGQGNKWVQFMAMTVRKMLLRVCPNGRSFHTQISEMLDPEIISNQLRVGSFSYEKFFSFMATILPKVVSPARDPLVKAFASDTSNDYVERLAKLLHILDLNCIDYANYLLMMSAPELIKRAGEYEQQFFQKEVEQHKLTQTTTWWRHARDAAISNAARHSPEGSRITPTSQKIYTAGLIDLFIALSPLQQQDIPEILLLDQSRIERIRSDILRIITVASVLLTAKNLLKRDVRSQWKAQAQRMWDLPPATAYTESGAYVSIIESAGHALPPAARTSLLGTIDRVLADARNAPQQRQPLTQPVMKVLLQKIRAHVAARLGAASAQEKLRGAATASEVLGNGGLAEFVGRIGGLVEEMGRVRQVDWDGHGKWIDEVAAKVEQEVRG